MKYLFPFLFLLYACSSRQDDSLDNAVEQTLKHDRGVEIEIRPLEKVK